MAQENNVQSISLPAGADLSALQYTFVALNSSGAVVAPSGAGGDAIGVLQDKPTSGQTGQVAYAGKVKVKAGATVATGAKVQTDANGAAITAASGDVVLGVCMAGGASGAVIEVLLQSQHILA